MAKTTRKYTESFKDLNLEDNEGKKAKDYANNPDIKSLIENVENAKGYNR
mgnify:CR=1 FL=1